MQFQTQYFSVCENTSLKINWHVTHRPGAKRTKEMMKYLNSVRLFRQPINLMSNEQQGTKHAQTSSNLSITFAFRVITLLRNSPIALNVLVHRERCKSITYQREAVYERETVYQREAVCQRGCVSFLSAERAANQSQSLNMSRPCHL